MSSITKKRKCFTLEDKIAAIDRLKKGSKLVQVARDYGTNESTVRGWRDNEQKLRQSLNSLEESGGLQRKKLKLAKDEDLDKAIYTWFCRERTKGMPISGPIIKAQAQKFNRELNGNEEFLASDGWLDKFKKRHGISKIAISGECRSADVEAADAYPLQLRTIIQEGGYHKEQIYNADETGLYFKMLPDVTLAAKGEKGKKEGYKQAKDRITVLFCVNKTGSHKLKPLVIGKFANPRCFHHINRATLPVSYKNSKNAWMTSKIFEDWFHKEFVPDVRKHLRRQKLETKAILLLDNCPAHPPAETLTSKDGKIKVVYLPKNTTSKIQPLDQGVIATFKMLYRKSLVRAMIDENTEVTDFIKRLNLKECFYIASKAWDGVTAKTIENCWMKGLGPAFDLPQETESQNDDEQSEEEEDFEGFTQADVDEARRVLQKCTNEAMSSDDVQKWIACDEDCPTSSDITDEDIIAEVRGEETEVNNEEEEDEKEDSGDAPPKIAEAIAGLEVGLQWLETQEVDSIKVLQLRGLIDFAKTKRNQTIKQKGIMDYFKKAN